ncbi:MAG TPA: AMP-binding protein [Chthoniobacterales bacterium]
MNAPTSLPAPAHPRPWREILRTQLPHRPQLVWVLPEAAVPGPTIWTGLRGWVKAFRTVGLKPGDRVAVGGTPGLGWIGAVLAGLWVEATLCLVPPGESLPAAGEELDARFIVGPGGWIQWDCHGQPTVAACARRPVPGPRSPEARFLLASSGTDGRRKWIALSDANLLAVLRSHLPILGLNAQRRLLSTLPWCHAFGLVLEFLAALSVGASLVRCSEPRDADEQRCLVHQWQLNWWNLVPAMVRPFANTAPGAFGAFQGGIVGGAAISPGISALLAGSTLRVGYGQTEASPGIMLGAVGEFVPGLIGRPVGCEVRLSPDAELEFSGSNACFGHWCEGIVRAAPDRWVKTGDGACKEVDRYLFLGRRDDQVRMGNGRTFSALRVERTLQGLCPAVAEVMVWSPDGADLAMAFTGPAPHPSAVAEALGPLARRLRTVQQIGAECWRYTPKGDLDRTLTRTILHGA